MKTIKSLIFSLLFLFLSFQAYAALELKLIEGLSAALPIAVIPFSGQGARQERIDQIISQDLYASGRFRTVQPAAGATETPTNQKAWRQWGVDYVVNGEIERKDGDEYEVKFQLIDVVGQKSILLSEEYSVSATDLRRLAHKISDQVYYQLTGERGIFSTRVAYVRVEQPSETSRRYILEVADIDGDDPQPLVTSSEPMMSPAWSPNGQQIAYVSFEGERAQIYISDIVTGERTQITSYPGINGAPVWSPDGEKLAVVLSKDGVPKIYTVDIASGSLQQLTYGMSIDTEPKWDAEGKYLLFTSDRGGSPQIYRLNTQDNQVKRLTFTGNYNARANYSPDG
ncbi:MAG: Tol-Pal system beta propeller repeat protein TolB, partial [Gammaproteobacteria bacterium]